MTSECNEQLPVFNDSPTETQSDWVQIWIIRSREQVTHQMNEFYVRKMTNDFFRKHFVSGLNLPPSSRLRLRQEST
jgi:hypothetical protein